MKDITTFEGVSEFMNNLNRVIYGVDTSKDTDEKQASEETDNTILSDHERAMEDKASELQDEFTGQ